MTKLENKEKEGIPEAYSRQSIFYKRGINDILELASNVLADTNKYLEERIENKG